MRKSERIFFFLFWVESYRLVCLAAVSLFLLVILNFLFNFHLIFNRFEWRPLHFLSRPRPLCLVIVFFCILHIFRLLIFLVLV